MGGEAVPEPFDVRTEEGLEAGAMLMDGGVAGARALENSQDSGRSSGKNCV